MGAGSSVGGVVSLKNKSFENKENLVIPLRQLAGHLKVYQHCTTGEVLVLVDHDIEDIGYVVDNPKEWFPVTVSKHESKYLETLKVQASLNDNDVLTLDSKISSINIDKSNTFPSLNKNEIIETSLRKNTLPDISYIPKTVGSIGPLRKVEANISPRRLVPLTNPSSDALSPRSPRFKLEDVSSNWTESFKSNVNSLTQSSPAKYVKKIRGGIDLSAIYGKSKSNSSPELRERTLAPEDELKDVENVMGENNDGDDNGTNTDLTRLVRDNLVYDADIRTYSCQICGDIADEAFPMEQLEDHVLRCVTKRELQIRFTDINNSLEPEILLMSKFNSFQMSAFISKAMTHFEKRSALNNQALSLIRRVVNIPYYASDGKWLSLLGDEITRLKSSLQDNLNEHRLTVADGGSDRELYEDMKTLYRILQTAITQINAKRSALRKFNQYIMDVNHFTFLRHLSKGAFSTVYLGE